MRCQASASVPPAFRRCQGMTLTNLMVSLAVSLVVLGAVISSHLFGLRLFEIARIKLDAVGDDPRKFYDLAADLGTVKLVRVGQGSSSSFTEAAVNAPQQGNALQIYPTADTNSFIRYYLDPADSTLKRRGLDGRVSTVAQNVTNAISFRAENLSGVVLSNTQNHSVIGLDLQFSAIGHASDRVGAGRTFSGYRVRTKLAVRAPD